MANVCLSRPLQSREQEVHKLSLSAGAAYGLIFGLSFALFGWGRDALLLSASKADLAWANLLLGLPIALAIGALTGWLAARLSSTVAFIVLWALACALLGAIAGHLPYEGGNVAAWLADPRLSGLTIFPYGRSAAVRTTLAVVIETALGAAVGFVESLAVERAGDRAIPGGGMGLKSWAILTVCVPLALVCASIVGTSVTQPLRTPLQKVGELVALTQAGKFEEIEAKELAYTAIEPFVQQLSSQYVLYLSEYDLQTLRSAYVDIAFDNGFELRCATLDVGTFDAPIQEVIYCDDISQKLAAWTDDLVHAGLSGERRWLNARWQSLAVDDDVVAWLTTHRDQLSKDYAVSRAGQRGGWILVAVRFDTGFEMVCRFHGTSPVQVDQCAAINPSRP